MTPDPFISLYRQADSTYRRRGRIWYPEMRRHLEGLAQEFDRPLAQVAAVLAITSVDAQLASNLRWTREILEGTRKAGRYPANQIPKIEGALSTRYPGRFVTGPKCSAFYRAVMGDPDALVLDRWMFMPVIGRQRRSVGKRLWAQVDHAYRAAATECAVSVRAFQATIWLLLRETTPDDKGRIPRLLDITRGA